MYSELHRYFLQYKELNLPGIGNIVLERNPAVADFINKCIYPPSFAVSLHKENEKQTHRFYTWLAAAYNISEKEAVIKFNDFIFNLKNEIKTGNKIEWEGVGVLSKALGGDIKFSGQQIDSTEKAVTAEKIIRDKAEHSVLVGTNERTSAEMTEFYNQPDAKRNLWWVLPLAFLLLSFMFIGWYFSTHGINSSSVSNTQKIRATVATESYSIVK